jgi:uncharacterized protein (DUF433 family)
MVDTIHEHIEVTSTGGRTKARIAGHRIRVQDVAVWHERLGMSVDEIVHEYPSLTLADVYAALAYYWDNRELIEQAIREDNALVEEFRRTHIGPLQRKLASLDGE